MPYPQQNPGTFGLVASIRHSGIGVRGEPLATHCSMGNQKPSSTKKKNIPVRVNDHALTSTRSHQAQETDNLPTNVIRLSLGKLWVNLWQVVKRTNTPLNTLTNGVVDRPWVFWIVGPNPTIHNNNKLF